MLGPSLVVLATTCWDLVDPDTGMAHKDFIKTTKWYWGGMITSGSHVFRQDEEKTSARAIIEYLVQKRTMADASLIPVSKGKNLSKTHADLGSNAHSLQLQRRTRENDATWEARCEEERRSSKAKNDKYQEDIQKLQAEVHY
jgi:hypothetical protein